MPPSYEPETVIGLLVEVAPEEAGRVVVTPVGTVPPPPPVVVVVLVEVDVTLPPPL